MNYSKEYEELLAEGKLLELYPHLTGHWIRDKHEWTQIQQGLERPSSITAKQELLYKKEYDRLINAKIFSRLYPKLSGKWPIDKHEWIQIQIIVSGLIEKMHE